MTISLDHLVPDAKRVLAEDSELQALAASEDIDTTGITLVYRIHPDTDFAHPDASYWRRLKREFCLFAASDDPKYKDLRERIRETSTGGTLVLSAVSAAVGAHIGVEAAIVMPFVALLVIGSSGIGMNAFCSEHAIRPEGGQQSTS